MSNNQIWQTLWRMSRSLISATFIAQILTYICIPFLSRLYEPIQFGEWGIFIGITTAGALLGTWRMESWFMQIKESDQAVYWKWGIRNLLLTSVIFGMISSFIIPSLFPEMKWNGMFLLLPLGIFSQGIFNLILFRTGAAELQRQHVRLKLFNAILSNSLMIGFFYWGPFNGLIQGWILGQGLSILFVLSRIPKFQKQNFVIGLTQVMSLPFRPFYLTAQALLENFQAAGLSAWIGWVYGPIPAALFFMSWRLLQAPINLISNSLFLSQYHLAQTWHNEQKNYIPMMNKALLALGSISALALLTWFFKGPELVTQFLGKEWAQTSDVINAILPWMISFFIFSPFSFLLLIHHKSQWLLGLTLLDTIQKLLILSHLWNNSFIEAIQISSYISMLIILLQWWLGRKAEVNFVAS